MLRFLIVLLFASVTHGLLPSNPCPNIFQYKYFKDQYYGEITIPYDDESRHLNLEVQFSLPGFYRNLKLDLQGLTPLELLGSTPFINYRVGFPTPPDNFNKDLPIITQATFNGRIICTGPPYKDTSRGVTSLQASLYYNL
ncbi:uncharacterized protein LOC123009089 [Tribolium madens]|uniref:uncharacterized protein LOC123009089 n=1 Tax=Tribolium madens TaxID=41895 RepID=UPI001CF75C0F|nr:uncharacterized protein LOC123009089 [Tribolium madens]